MATQICTAADADLRRRRNAPRPLRNAAPWRSRRRRRPKHHPSPSSHQPLAVASSEVSRRATGLGGSLCPRALLPFATPSPGPGRPALARARISTMTLKAMVRPLCSAVVSVRCPAYPAGRGRTIPLPESRGNPGDSFRTGRGRSPGFRPARRRCWSRSRATDPRKRVRMSSDEKPIDPKPAGILTKSRRQAGPLPGRRATERPSRCRWS
jgi:hypothetical protein